MNFRTITVLLGIFASSVMTAEEAIDLEFDSGRRIDGARIIERTPAQLIVVTNEGIDTILISNLTKELRNKLGYDQEKSKAYLESSKEKQDSQLEIEESEALKKSKGEIKKPEIQSIEILQVLDAGSLVTVLKKEIETVSSGLASVGGGGSSRTYEYLVPSERVLFVEELVGIDGERLLVEIVGNGTYQYVDTMGAKRTVQKFTSLRNRKL